MRAFRAAFTAALRTGHLSPFLNFEIKSDPEILLTNLPGGIVLGGKTYQPVGVVEYELAKVAAIPQKNPIRFHLEGYGDYRALLSAIGSEVDLHVGTASDRDGVDRLYPGVLVDAKEVIDFEQESRLVVLTIDTMFYDLDATNTRHTLADHQVRFDSTDTAFDEVHDNIARIDTFWGRGI